MAIFTTDPNTPARFDDFDINALDGNYLYVANATSWRRGDFASDIGTFIEFQGSGFTYAGGGLTGGTISSISSYIAGGLDFQIEDMSISAASYNAFRLANDNQGFFAAVFSGADDITGSNGKDHLFGYAGADKLTGLDGDDILDGGAGSDTLVGGKGNDLYILDSASDIIQESGGSTYDTVSTAFSVDLTKAAFAGIENVLLNGAGNFSATGNGSSNYLEGNNSANKLNGGLGDDTLMGHAGKDTLDGGAGNDQMYGGQGDDIYYVDSVNDLVAEFAGNGDDGNDTVFSSAKSYTLSDDIENLTLTGAALQGYGNDLDNKIVGNANNNLLIGYAGADTMTGGAGNDQYFVDNIGDKTVETNNLDSGDAVYSTVNYTLSQYVDNLILLGNADINGTGNGIANQIYGNTKDNALLGLGGNDDLSGGGGNDSLVGGAGNDALRGGAGNDTLDVSQGNDTVYYASKLDGHDVILGFDGNATGGQDVLNLDGYFDQLGVAAGDRAGRVGLADNGATVDVWIDTDGNNFLDTSIVTINTADAVTVGQDILVGS